MSDRTLIAQNAARGVAGMAEAAQAGSLLTGCGGVADGVARRLTVAAATRNIEPDGSRAQLIAAFQGWPLLVRMMDELATAYPDEARLGAEGAERLRRMAEDG